MARKDEDTEEPAADDEAPPLPDVRIKGARRSFSKLRRELTEDELSNPGTQKMLLDDLERLESDLSDARSYQDKYYGEARTVAVYEERFKTHKAFEVLSTGTVSIGALLAGGTFNTLTGTAPAYGLFGLGVLLLLVGIIAKAIKL